MRSWRRCRAVSQATLERARAGDGQAFRELTDPYRRELQLHCYRILGSLTDAEDMLQETLLAAWRGLAGFQERASVRSWLYRIATNRCLNALRDAGRRPPPEPVPPFNPPEPTRRGEITWLQPYPDNLLEGIAETAPGPEARYQAREAVELAFITALQRMPPRQAAALVLRDVLSFLPTRSPACSTPADGGEGRPAARAGHPGPPPRELPSADQGPGLGQPRSVNSAVASPRRSPPPTSTVVIALLTDDAWLSMPPAPHEYCGLDAIVSFLRASFAYRGERRRLPGVHPRQHSARIRQLHRRHRDTDRHAERPDRADGARGSNSAPSPGSMSTVCTPGSDFPNGCRRGTRPPLQPCRVACRGPSSDCGRHPKKRRASVH